MSKKKNKKDWVEATIEFRFKGKFRRWIVIHNLPKTFGMSIEDAFCCWSARTNTYTIGNFCEYVMSKDSSIICMSQKRYLAFK